MDITKDNLKPNAFYHIYNRGINGANIFFQEKNYSFFLQQYAKYTYAFVQTYAYCLIPNHFHLLIRVRSEEEIRSQIKQYKEKHPYWHVSKSIGSFLQSYTRAVNNAYDRSGPLLEHPFKRKLIDTEAYFSQLVAYIHRNPEHHGLVDDFKVYPHSSYWSHLVEKPTKLEKQEVLDWFGGKQPYVNFHKNQIDTKKIQALLLE